jgi:hypothetical protein
MSVAATSAATTAVTTEQNSVKPESKEEAMTSKVAFANFNRLGEFAANEWPTTLGSMIVKDERYGLSQWFRGPRCDIEVVKKTAAVVIEAAPVDSADKEKLESFLQNCDAAIQGLRNISTAFARLPELAKEFDAVRNSIGVVRNSIGVVRHELVKEDEFDACMAALNPYWVNKDGTITSSFLKNRAHLEQKMAAASRKTPVIKPKRSASEIASMGKRRKTMRVRPLNTEELNESETFRRNSARFGVKKRVTFAENPWTKGDALLAKLRAEAEGRKFKKD